MELKKIGYADWICKIQLNAANKIDCMKSFVISAKSFELRFSKQVRADNSHCKSIPEQ
jgi:hypothetical protein